MSRGNASIGDYVVTSKLGNGSFAVVYKGYHKMTKLPVAIKAMSLSKLNGKLLSNLESEIAIMRQIDHPNIVKLYDIKKTEKHIYLVLEYCAGGDLQQYMRRQATKPPNQARAGVSPLSEEVAQHFLHELAMGMKCLWSNNLIHRDLKPQNLLLAEDSDTSALKIADFGFARHLATASLAETLCGSPLYMAPEILKFQKYDAKADLWSVGTILFEMVTGSPPYSGGNHVQLLANIERMDVRFPKDIALSSDCRDLLVGLLRRDPMARLGFDEFFGHVFVTSRESKARRSIGFRNPISIAESSEADNGGAEGADAKDGFSSGLRQSAKDRADSASNVDIIPSDMPRGSKSGNVEVMETAFGSASQASSGGLLSGTSRSRVGRGRRSTSSGAILVGQNVSPKLSPQMSPDMLPSPSPRINPFKTLSESPPGAAALLNSSSLRNSITSTHSAQRVKTSGVSAGNHKRVKSSGHVLDSSGEYVLVESSGDKEKADQGSQLRSRPSDSSSHRSGSSSVSSSHVLSPTSSSGKPPLAASTARMPPFSHEYAQKLVDAIILRTQAISPIAEQLWNISCSISASQEEAASSTNVASMFSLSSSTSSSTEQIVIGSSTSASAVAASNSTSLEKKQYVCAAEALALYVKCLGLVQYGVVYLRQDPTLQARASQNLTSSRSPPKSNMVPWGEASRKLSKALLVEQLNFFLDRAEQCKKRMISCLSSAGQATELRQLVISPEELLYNHALRLGKDAAVKEVLGQMPQAYDIYLQAMLLLESLLMETGNKPTTLAAEDHKSINAFLEALEDRMKSVQEQVAQDSANASERKLLGTDTSAPPFAPLYAISATSSAP